MYIHIIINQAMLCIHQEVPSLTTAFTTDDMSSLSILNKVT